MKKINLNGLKNVLSPKEMKTNYNMKPYRTFFVILFSLTILIACKQKQQETEDKTIFIPLAEKKDMDIYDLFEDIKYIALETNDSSLLTGISSSSFSKLILKNGYIYTSDVSIPLIIFDENGKWIRTIEHKGPGPGEYLNLSQFAVSNNKEIAIVDASLKKILFYSWEGRFLASSTFHGDYQQPRSAFYLNDSLLVVYTPSGQSEGFQFHILNRNTLDFINSYWPTYARQYSVGVVNFFVEFQGKYIFYSPLNPHIYELTADSETLRYTINVGGKISPDDYWDIKDMSWTEIREKNMWEHLYNDHREKGYIDNIMFFSEADETIILKFSDLKNTFDGTYALIDKKTHNSVLFDKITFDSHLNWKPPTMFCTSDGIVVIPIPADILLESGEGEIRKMFPNLLEDDNPILCIGKLR